MRKARIGVGWKRCPFRILRRHLITSSKASRAGQLPPLSHSRPPHKVSSRPHRHLPPPLLAPWWRTRNTPTSTWATQAACTLATDTTHHSKVVIISNSKQCEYTFHFKRPIVHQNDSVHQDPLAQFLRGFW